MTALSFLQLVNGAAVRAPACGAGNDRGDARVGEEDRAAAAEEQPFVPSIGQAACHEHAARDIRLLRHDAKPVFMLSHRFYPYPSPQRTVVAIQPTILLRTDRRVMRSCGKSVPDPIFCGSEEQSQ